ncbi:ATP-binding protein [Thermococcus barophilus]|uniref:ATPase domain-containing protein n=1 Tax=Thermococcus barophilus TaxID=55802 RepID=A0A0S1XCU5_THEBA|nr:ATP-binding protein [Thermococcus barophilus]ALM75552.1 hypothetical protein TBCH5v1_1639 [Thermococcus barophilus]
MRKGKEKTKAYYFSRGNILPLGWLIGRHTPEPELDNKSPIEVLEKYIETKTWTAVTGPRLVGKTTFTRSIARHLEQGGYIEVYVNVAGIKDFPSFVLKTYQKLPNSTKLEVRREYGDVTVKLGISAKGGYGEVGKNLEHPKNTIKSYASIVLDFMLKHLPDGSILIWDEVQDLGEKNIATLLSSLWRVYNEIEDDEKRPEILVTGSSVRLLRLFLEPAEEGYEDQWFVGREFENILLRPWDRDTFENYVYAGFEYYDVPITLREVEWLWEYSHGLPGITVLYGYGRCVRKLSHKKVVNTIRKSQLAKIRDEIFRLIEFEFPKAAPRLQKALKLFAQGKSINEIIKSSKTSRDSFYGMLRLLEKNGYLIKDSEFEGRGEKEYHFAAKIYEDAIKSWRI